MLVVTLVVIGCAQKGTPGAPGQSSATALGDQSGWWCNEHGVPEEECSICSSKAAADFKKKGDWCKEHNRAESQCFLCSPARADKYAALYEAKFGKKPPKPTE
jgi:cobalt-zinc-cadmium efflux system membrane fusion protein